MGWSVATPLIDWLIDWDFSCVITPPWTRSSTGPPSWHPTSRPSCRNLIFNPFSQRLARDWARSDRHRAPWAAHPWPRAPRSNSLWEWPPARSVCRRFRVWAWLPPLRRLPRPLWPRWWRRRPCRRRAAAAGSARREASWCRRCRWCPVFRWSLPVLGGRTSEEKDGSSCCVRIIFSCTCRAVSSTTTTSPSSRISARGAWTATSSRPWCRAIRIPFSTARNRCLTGKRICTRGMRCRLGKRRYGIFHRAFSVSSLSVDWLID